MGVKQLDQGNPSYQKPARCPVELVYLMYV